ncbi:TIGR01458 family HAD-type hydrolase [Moorena sp. SIO3B2]|uniref:TIGR01458 family HAD-type hydrolase n=1 Tax=Moorena sp. SIO3B2 TaxID=2607827 RepID=UPI0013CAC382|nr:TIGR01458 family HAD-type hydrolase [Moorena sp. SIO3B2]NEP33510.1 TIGR01458 family HAD-type hydrolase [Moorena sp. SIO3B2]
MVNQIKTALIDIDGTVYFKGALIPGVKEAIDELRTANLHLRFLTNSDSRSGAQLAERIAEMGLTLDPSEIYTAADAASTYTGQAHKTCFCLMPERLHSLFNHAPTDAPSVDYVVLGDQSTVATYDQLNQAFRYIRAGAELVVMQKGQFYITEDGENLDTGAFATLLEYASGTVATVVGKPSARFFHGVLAELGVSPEETIVVGDDIYSDVVGAKTIGATSILVRTGKYAEQRAAIDETQIDYEIDSLADLPELLARLS